MEGLDKKSLEFIIDAIDSYQATVLIVNADRKVVFANKPLCEKWGRSRQELINMTIDEYMAETASKFVWVAKSLETGKAYFDASQLSESVELEVMSYPMLDEKGKVTGAIAIGFDDELVKRLDGIIKDAERKKEGASRAITYLTEKSGGEGFIYADKKMKRVFESAGLIAATDSTVLINGESGTGKEIVANYIHKNSKRKDNIFMPVNCGAIPENLLEAEFFGYEKGAFTGADKNGKAGLFEIADKGTLFLDEIGELPLLMQAKLLRVLETGELKRIGGAKRIFTDVRIVAATNKNLEEMVKQNKFREDLFYRLSVIPVSIPPLRERPDDIAVLMQFYAEKFNKKYKTKLVIDEHLLKKYKNYSWPGNVRELKNEVERLAIYSLGGGLGTSSAANKGGALSSEENAEYKDRIMEDAQSGMKLKELVEIYERELLKKCLEKNGGNVRKTAAQLGIDRSSFYRKIKEEQM